MHNNLFENQNADTQRTITQELQRVVGGDPRVQINGLQLFPQENGMLIQVELIFVPGTNAESLAIFFNQGLGQASYV